MALAEAKAGISIVHVNRIRKRGIFFRFSPAISLEPHPATKPTAVLQSWKHSYNSMTHKSKIKLIPAVKDINYSSAENNKREKNTKKESLNKSSCGFSENSPLVCHTPEEGGREGGM